MAARQGGPGMGAGGLAASGALAGIGFRGVRSSSEHAWGAITHMEHLEPLRTLKVDGFLSQEDAAIARDYAALWGGLQAGADPASLELNLPASCYTQRPTLLDFLCGASFEELEQAMRQMLRELNAVAAASGGAAGAKRRRSDAAGAAAAPRKALRQYVAKSDQAPAAAAAAAAAAAFAEVELAPELLGRLRSETAAVKTVVVASPPGAAKQRCSPRKAAAAELAMAAAPAAAADSQQAEQRQQWRQQPATSAAPSGATQGQKAEQRGQQEAPAAERSQQSAESSGGSGGPCPRYGVEEGEAGQWQAFIYANSQRNKTNKRRELGAYSSAERAGLARDVAHVWSRLRKQEDPAGGSLNFPQLQLHSNGALRDELAQLTSWPELRVFIGAWLQQPEVERQLAALSLELAAPAQPAAAGTPGGSVGVQAAAGGSMTQRAGQQQAMTGKEGSAAASRHAAAPAGGTAVGGSGASAGTSGGQQRRMSLQERLKLPPVGPRSGLASSVLSHQHSQPQQAAQQPAVGTSAAAAALRGQRGGEGESGAQEMARELQGVLLDAELELNTIMDFVAAFHKEAKPRQEQLHRDILAASQQGDAARVRRLVLLALWAH